MSKRIACVVVALLLACPLVSAAPREARVPLRDGKLRTADLSAALCREVGLPSRCAFDCGDIDLSGLRGCNFIEGLNEALGDGCNVSIHDDALVLRVDTEKLPDDMRSAKRAARVFTAVAAPDATAKQRAYYGLWTPKDIDPAKPLVVLVHGLDCDRLNWQSMVE